MLPLATLWCHAMHSCLLPCALVIVYSLVAVNLIAMHVMRHAQWLYCCRWINQHLLSIMALLLPLRRICSGGMLSPKDLQLPTSLVDLADAMSGAVPSAAGLVVPADLECSICLDAFESPVSGAARCEQLAWNVSRR